MNTELIKQQRAEAKLNSCKQISELKVGDFINLEESGMKNDSGHLQTAVGDMFECGIPSPIFCRIEKIVECTEDELKNQKFEFGPGGSKSDAIEDDDNFNMYNPTSEQLHSFYQKVTLVKCADGRHVFIDAQGYDYPRYIMFSSGWGTMFAKELEAHKKEVQEREERDRKEKQDRIDSVINKAYKDFGWIDPTKTTVYNLKQILLKKFPNSSFRVSLKDSTINITNADVNAVKSYLYSLDKDYTYETFEEYSDVYSWGFYYRNALEDMIGVCNFGLLYVDLL